ncbi:MAG: hypothetical protein D6732_24775 [Methanobacteriota archaeon]|nr:MAG: hypothetical protein D6732_24775 [Euryarchaeota archaeon]
MDDLMELRKHLSYAREHSGQILFPTQYQHLYERYDSLNFSGNSTSNSNIQRLLVEAESFARLCEAGEVFFQDIIHLRERAIEQGAENYAPESFQDAEQQFQKAVNLFLKGKMPFSEIEKLRKMYQKAEFVTIRDYLLGEFRISLRESEEMGAQKYVPRTYSLARRLLSQIERLVSREQYNNESLYQKTEQLEATLKVLHKFQKLLVYLEQSPENRESFLIELETFLSNIREKLPDSETDLGNDFQQNFTDLEAEIEALSKRVNFLVSEIQTLREDKLKLEKELWKKSSESERTTFLQRKISNILVNTRFPVEQDQNILRISIDSIQFVDNTSTLKPTTIAMVNEVARLLKEFPFTPVVVLYVEQIPADLPQQPDLLMKRALTIRKVLAQKSLSSENQIMVDARYQRIENASASLNGYVEVTINLNEYLENFPFGVENPTNIPSSHSQSTSE